MAGLSLRAISSHILSICKVLLNSYYGICIYYLTSLSDTFTHGGIHNPGGRVMSSIERIEAKDEACPAPTLHQSSHILITH